MSSVPSFTSFPDLPPDLPAKSTDLRGYFKEGEKKSDDRHGRHKHKRRRSRDRTEPSEDKHHRDEQAEIGSDALGPEQSEQKSRVFCSDRRGDPYNVEYGTLYAGDIPRYNLVDRGRTVLGLSNGWVAYHRGTKGVEVGPRGPTKMMGLIDPKSKELLAAPPKRIFLQSGHTYKHPEIDGFLRLPSGKRDKNEQPYRSITIKSDSEFDSEVLDFSADESSQSEPQGLALTTHQIKTKEIDKRLNEDPTNSEEWLNLLSHTLSTIPLTSKNATTVRSEITVSILSRCFAADQRNRRARLLRVMYMMAGEEIWHESRVKVEWEDALKDGGIEIWMEWLEWRIRKGNEGVDGVVDDALRLLKILDSNEQDEFAKVRVFWRVAVAMKNAGYQERAIGIFQAQAELMFEVPQALYGLPHEEQVAQLEEFWESEVPRLGEEGAEGWAAWTTSGSKNGQIQLRKSSTVPSVMDLDPYRQWAARELSADERYTLPSRSSEDSNDPFCTTLFSDLQPLLMPLKSQRAKCAFRIAWLSLLGLNVPGFAASLSSADEINWDDRWCESHLLKPSYLAALVPRGNTEIRLGTESVVGTMIGREKEYRSGFGPVRSWGLGVVNPLYPGFRGEKLGKSRKPYILWGPEAVESLDVSFTRRLFTQLRLGDDDVEWDLLALAFEAAVNIKHSLKISKSFLSKRESLARWAAHAHLETLRGRFDEARKLYQTVLGVCQGTSSPSGVSLLWWGWAEMEWLAGNNKQALSVLFRAVGAKGQSDMNVLRSRRILDDAIRDEVDWKHRECWIKMRALLELLTTKEPTAAMNVYDELLVHEPRKSVRRESLLIACLTMLYHYGPVLKNPLPQSFSRERVNKALEEFPNNSVFLGLFLEGEKGQGVWGRIRGVLGEGGGQDKGVLRRTQEVWVASWELGRWLSEIERTRSGLAAAVESERTRGSHIIWRIYLEVEIQAGQLRRAKQLFFRAIGECPLVKELYLLAFGPLREVFSGEELRSVGDTMVERGIRLREGLDEALAGWNDVPTSKDGGDASNGGEDEIEERARELRRLMPL